MNRFDKLEYLLETCTAEFIKDCLFVRELVACMGESEFDEFYQRLCSRWDIKTEEER